MKEIIFSLVAMLLAGPTQAATLKNTPQETVAGDFVNSAPTAKTSRTYKEVSLVFDKNKGAIYSLYSRALRQNPTLKGGVVLEITIDPSGRVTECKIVTSELNSPEFESKLIERVKLLNFGESNAEVKVVKYPLRFLPS